MQLLIIGDKNKKNRQKILDEAKKNPIRLGDAIIENSAEEKYLGDMIDENGCAVSITETPTLFKQWKTQLWVV